MSIRKLLFIVLILQLITLSCSDSGSKENVDDQGNTAAIKNGNNNTIVQVNIKIENIETSNPITDGKIVLKIDNDLIEGILNNQGVATLDVKETLLDKPARLIVQDSKGNEQYSQNYIVQATKEEPKKIAIQPFKRFVVDEINGQIAQGAANEYTFSVEPNVPLLIQVKGSGKLSFTIEILNSATETILKKGTFYRSAIFNNIPFTAPKKDTYTLRVLGYNNEGSYTIHVIYVDSDADQTNSKLKLVENQQHYDKVGKGSYDAYLFDGVPNQTAIIQSKGTDNLGYLVQLYNSIGERIFSKGTFYKSDQYNNIPFTPLDSGQYEIRIEATNGFGSYDLRYYNLAVPVFKQAEFDTIMSALLGEGGYHEYQFTGVRNQTVKVKTMGLENLSYQVQVFNASGEQLLKKGTYYRSEKFADNLFTPDKDGDYMVRIVGTNHFGEYKILMEKL